MNWYNGDIEDAVAESKCKNAIFLVYVEDTNYTSTKMKNFLNDKRICKKLQTDDFVAIKIHADSEEYMQFASIYQIVPIPSIFLIGEAGIPLEIVTGVVASVEELEEQIDSALVTSGRPPAEPLCEPVEEAVSAAPIPMDEMPSTSSASKLPPGPTAETTPEVIPESATNPLSESVTAPMTALIPDQLPAEPKSESSTDPELGSDSAKVGKQPKREANESAESPSITLNASTTIPNAIIISGARVTSEQEKDESVQEPPNTVSLAKKPAASSQLGNPEKREQPDRLETAKEKKYVGEEAHRGRDEKDSSNLQDWQRDSEYKEAREKIRRARSEEQATRKRILEQIATDRAEQALKFALNVEETMAGTTAPVNTSVTTADTTRIQFRLPNGVTRTQVFNYQDTLSDVRNYVTGELLPGSGIRDYILATTYPKLEYSENHNAETLTKLGLCPSAVILVIAKRRNTNPATILAHSGGFQNILIMLMNLVLAPFYSIYNYIRFGSHRPRDQPLDAASTSTAANSLANANIHGLSDNSQDSDDENATWNGNSTQQQ